VKGERPRNDRKLTSWARYSEILKGGGVQPLAGGLTFRGMTEEKPSQYPFSLEGKDAENPQPDVLENDFQKKHLVGNCKGPISEQWHRTLDLTWKGSSSLAKSAMGETFPPLESTDSMGTRNLGPAIGELSRGRRQHVCSNCVVSPTTKYTQQTPGGTKTQRKKKHQ